MVRDLIVEQAHEGISKTKSFGAKTNRHIDRLVTAGNTSQFEEPLAHVERLANNANGLYHIDWSKQIYLITLYKRTRS